MINERILPGQGNPMSGAPNIVGNQARPATPSVPGVAGAPPANLGAAVQSLMPAAKPGFAGTPWVGGQTDSSMTEGGGNWGGGAFNPAASGGVGGLPVRKTIMPIGASGVDAGEIGTPWERMFPPTVKR